ncbi:MAG: zf-HC2 domain-containing protein [Acidobacteria bacterium]|nr:zf-HC2 domain-containing protein [Acidobacteriota bacterium]
MMTCEEVLQEISSYLDEEVVAELRRQIEEHLRKCHHCTVLVNTTRKTLTLVADYYVLELPESVSRKLLDRLAPHLQ